MIDGGPTGRRVSEYMGRLIDFLRNSQSHRLKRLTVEPWAPTATAEEFLALLDLVPSLEELLIHGDLTTWSDLEDDEYPAIDLTPTYFTKLVRGMSEPVLRSRSKSLRLVSIDLGSSLWQQKVVVE